MQGVAWAGWVLVSVLAGTVPVAPVSGGNALTLPAQRHLLRFEHPGGGPATWLMALQQGSSGQGLGFWRSDDEGVSWRHAASIQPDASHNDRADLVQVGMDVALVYSWESSTLSGSSRHDVYFQWWRYSAPARDWVPEAPVRIFDSPSSASAYSRALLARDSQGRLWVQAFRLESGGASTAVLAVSEDEGQSWRELPELGRTRRRGGGRLLHLGDQLLFVWAMHDGGEPTRMRVHRDADPPDVWSEREDAFSDGIYHGAALSAVADGRGGMHLVYKDEREQLYYRHFDGQRFGARTLLEDRPDWALQAATTRLGDALVVFYNRVIEPNEHYELRVRVLREGRFSAPEVLDGSRNFKGYPAAAEVLPGDVPGVPCAFGQEREAGTRGTEMLVSLPWEGGDTSEPPPPPPPPVVSAPLIARGSVWKYHDANVDPGLAWTGAAFDDSGWKSGPAQLGYGDTDEATVLTRTSPSQPSVYFRKRFSLAALPTRASLSVLFDDAVAVWVNGTLVFSRNVAGGTAHGAYASASSGDNAQASSALALSPNPFRLGDNTVAVMVKQASATSSDLSFDLELTADVPVGEPAPALNVLHPNGGETLAPGSTTALRWATVGRVPEVVLEYSADDGQTWTTLAEALPNTGSFTWTLPDTLTREGRVRVSDARDSSLADTSDAAFSLEVPPPPAPLPVTRTLIPFGSEWRYHDGNVDPGLAWTGAAFDDSGWRSGPAQLGYGDGDEATVLRRTSPSQPSVYFRKRFSLSALPVRASLDVLFDDAVAVWVNGTLVFSRNVGRGTSHAVYASASSGDNARAGAPLSLSPSPFRLGDNTVAVMVKQASSTSSDLSFDLALTADVAGEDGEAPPPAGEPVVAKVVPFGSTWRYDDRNRDPGSGWTARTFDDSGWRSGPAQLGYGDGDEATRLTRTSPSQPSVYFRRTFSVAGRVSAARLSVLYDDAVAVWVNGSLVFSRNMGAAPTHPAYATSSSEDNARASADLSLSPNPFTPGENTVAVMVKQAGTTSSDLSFDLELELTHPAP